VVLTEVEELHVGAERDVALRGADGAVAIRCSDRRRRAEQGSRGERFPRVRRVGRRLELLADHQE
jgi:hypothetical protein